MHSQQANTKKDQLGRYQPYPSFAGNGSKQDVDRVLATGRRSHKLSQTTGEAVWPVRLEAVLIDALRVYGKSEKPSRPTKRHPKRNRFISEYILSETEQFRTPKQVGSRIQQLKETCSDMKIQALINQLEPEETWPSPPTRSPPSPPKDYSLPPAPCPPRAEYYYSEPYPYEHFQPYEQSVPSSHVDIPPTGSRLCLPQYLEPACFPSSPPPPPSPFPTNYVQNAGHFFPKQDFNRY